MPFLVDAPFVPGVPPVNRAPGALFDQPELLEADFVPEFGQAPVLQWGIYQNGQTVITADSVQAFEYRQEWSISNYPVEKGEFQSYNKVNSPFAARVRFTTGGSEADRAELLRSISSIADTTELYDLITPEVNYVGVNVNHYDYRRTSYNGMGLMMVDVWVEEVRETGTTAFSQTKSPSGAEPIDDGTLQFEALTRSQQTQIDDTFGIDSEAGVADILGGGP